MQNHLIDLTQPSSSYSLDHLLHVLYLFNWDLYHEARERIEEEKQRLDRQTSSGRLIISVDEARDIVYDFISTIDIYRIRRIEVERGISSLSI